MEEHEGQPFIVMQLLQGETLGDRLAAMAAKHKLMPLDELLEIAIQFCDGLQAAQKRLHIWLHGQVPDAWLEVILAICSSKELHVPASRGSIGQE